MTEPEAYITDHDLKKQSQSAPAEIGTKSFMKGDYDNKPASGVEENKANQSQFRNSCKACPGPATGELVECHQLKVRNAHGHT